MKKSNLPSLSLKEIVSRDISKVTSHSKNIMFGALLVSTIAACSDKDVTTYADPSADTYDSGAYDVGTYQDSYDVGAYDVSDSDVTNYAD